MLLPNDAARKEAIKTWMRITFRIFGIGQHHRSHGISAYINIAQRIFSGEYKASTVRDELARIGGEPRHQIQEVLKEITNANCYHDWPEDSLRYFLFRYEESLARKNSVDVSESFKEVLKLSASQTIEHIYPKSASAASQNIRSEYFESRTDTSQGTAPAPSGFRPSESAEAHPRGGTLRAPLVLEKHKVVVQNFFRDRALAAAGSPLLTSPRMFTVSGILCFFLERRTAKSAGSLSA